MNLDTLTEQWLIHSDSCGHHAQVRKSKSIKRLTDVIQRSRAELSVELLGSEAAEITDGVGPQVEDVVPGERLPLLQHHHLSAEQGQLDGRPQPARPSAQNHTLKKNKQKTMRMVAETVRERALKTLSEKRKKGVKKKAVFFFKPHHLISVFPATLQCTLIFSFLRF